MLSRVADSLYWMSRYLERAEHTARLLDVNLQSMLDSSPEHEGGRWSRLLRCLSHDTASLPSPADPYEVTGALAFSPENHGSITTSIQIARENARQVRQQISSEMWEQLNSLYLRLRDTSIESIWNGEPHAFFTEIKQGIHLFQGITDATLSHGEGWHFIQAGRFLERATTKATLLDTLFADGIDVSERSAEVSDYLGWVNLLKSCTAFEAYCKVYTADVRPERMAEFLLLNPDFPHSVAFCATAIRESLDAIAAVTEIPRQARVNRLAGRLCAALDFSNIDEILASGLHRYLRDIQKQCAEIHAAVYQKYISYPIDAALVS